MNALVLVALGAVLAVFLILICPVLRRLDRPCTTKPGTLDNPDVAAMVARQKFHGRLLREDGKSLLRPLVDGRPRGHGKSYRPELTKPQPAPEVKPPKADKVVSIIRGKR